LAYRWPASRCCHSDMTGTMRERSPGHWQLRAFVGRDPMTRRKRQVQRTLRGTKRDAEKALTVLVTDVSQGRVDNTCATVGQLLDAWVEHIEPIRHPKTVHEASRSIELRWRPALGHIRLEKLSPPTSTAGTASGSKKDCQHRRFADCMPCCRWPCIPASDGDGSSTPPLGEPRLQPHARRT